MSKSSLSVSSNRIARFLNFAVEIGVGNEGDGLLAVI